MNVLQLTGLVLIWHEYLVAPMIRCDFEHFRVFGSIPTGQLLCSFTEAIRVASPFVTYASGTTWWPNFLLMQYHPLFCWFLFWLNRTAVLQFTMRMLISNNKIQLDCKNLRVKVVVGASCRVVDESEESIGDGEYQWVEGVGKPPRPGQKKN